MDKVIVLDVWDYYCTSCEQGKADFVKMEDVEVSIWRCPKCGHEMKVKCVHVLVEE